MQVHPLLKLVHGALALGNFVGVGAWREAPPVTPLLGVLRRKAVLPGRPGGGYTRQPLGWAGRFPASLTLRPSGKGLPGSEAGSGPSVDTAGFRQRLASWRRAFSGLGPLPSFAARPSPSPRVLASGSGLGTLLWGS